MVTHAFKAARVRNLHCKALKWPLSRIEVRGIDPPPDDYSFPHHEDYLGSVEVGRPKTGAGRMAWEEGEKRACREWEGDLYGVRADEKGNLGLGAKRKRRGWGGERGVDILWEGEGEGVRGLVAWKGGESGKEVFPEGLPWEEEG